MLIRCAALLSFSIFYLCGFSWLENQSTGKMHIMTMTIDYIIPFLEVFVVPYLLWFIYILITVVYFMVSEEEDFWPLAKALAFGMTLFLLVSWIYPNGLNLRPAIFPRENIFTDIVRFVYSHDTSTNVLPSIHVFNSLVVNMAIRRSVAGERKPWLVKGSRVLCFLIVASTILIKQHSILDVFTATVLAAAADRMFYGDAALTEQKRKLHRQLS